LDLTAAVLFREFDALKNLSRFRRHQSTLFDLEMRLDIAPFVDVGELLAEIRQEGEQFVLRNGRGLQHAKIDQGLGDGRIVKLTELGHCADCIPAGAGRLCRPRCNLLPRRLEAS
jgi:hypothetical protein